MATETCLNGIFPRKPKPSPRLVMAFIVAMCSPVCCMLITFTEVSSRVAPVHLLGTNSVLSWSLSFPVGPCSAAQMASSQSYHVTPTQRHFTFQLQTLPSADNGHTSQLSLCFQAPPICTQVSPLISVPGSGLSFSI